MATQEQQEKKRLTQEELQKIDKQCCSLMQTLFQYEIGMKGKDFKKWPQKKQVQIKKQFEFFKFSLNEGVKTLIMHHALTDELSEKVSGCKYVSLNTKFEILKYNKRKLYYRDDNN